MRVVWNPFVMDSTVAEAPGLLAIGVKGCFRDQDCDVDSAPREGVGFLRGLWMSCDLSKAFAASAGREFSWTIPMLRTLTFVSTV